MSTAIRRAAVFGGALVASTAVLTSTMGVASADDSTVPASRIAPTAAQVQAATVAKYGVFPLPVGVSTISEYQLKKRQIKEIVAAKKLANTRQARKIRKCESGGNYRTNTGNGYYGAYQFDRGTWLSNGGGRYARTANKAPKFAQDHIMYKTHRARGWQPWGCA